MLNNMSRPITARARSGLAETNAARFIAFYLPQFHPTPENSHWWGPGFTEWTNVTKAVPLFPGHRQPKFPADLGYYDLRVPETRAAQAELAANHGIEAFCYWHYWFAGRRILERPFEEVLKSREPDFPFCLCWANHSWTGIWSGAPNRLLIEQTYPGRTDFRKHFESLRLAFDDPRYFRVEGKPVFVVYAPRSIPQPREFADTWRDLAAHAGLKGIYLVGFVDHQSPGLASEGYDAWLTPTPDFLFRSDWTPLARLAPGRSGMYRGAKKIIKSASDTLHYHLYGSDLNVFSYADASRLAREIVPRAYARQPCVFPNWDNTPRSGRNGVVFLDSTPGLFAEHLHDAVEFVRDYPSEERIVWIKSWNEWAEGNYLEPDREYGLAYLNEVKRCCIG